MRHIVDAIAHQGRNGDDELIHVSKNEIAGLDGLSRRFYGRELPRNPKTGLKEASWLQAVLPAVAGIAAGALTGGTMAVPVGMAAGAAAGAGTSAAEGGTTEQALMAGVMGGIAGYGGAGIGAGLAEGAAGAAASGALEGGAGLAAEGTSAALPATATGSADVVANTATATGTETAVSGAANTGNTAATGTLNVANAPPPPAGETLSNTNMLAQPKSGVGLRVPEGGITSFGGETGASTNAIGVSAPVDAAGTTSVGGGSGVTAPPVQGSAPTLTGTPEKSINWGSLASDKGLSNLTRMGTGMVGGAMAVNGQPAPIDIPGETSTENPYEAEYYQGPGGEIRTRAVLKAAQGGQIFGDYDGVEDAAQGGLMGFAPGGSVGGISTIPSPVNAGNQTAKTGNVLPAGFFSKEEYAKATPEQRATMDRLMAAQREMVSSPSRKQFAGGGGIGFVRSMQPGGQWGDMTASMYGAVQEQKPQWLQNIEPGGFIGATVPGKMDYEDKKRAEAEAEEQKKRDAEAAAKKAAFAQSLKDQQAASVNRAMGMAAGGIASFGKGRYLQGPGDGMSDSIPASIDGKQEARLATGEFVVPADVVSHLGNGDSSAGAKQLHSMMDRARMTRTGTKKQGKQINPRKVMPV